ncbi:MAG: winged helix-turn-helix transcriptional regulator [Marmoricola sp.]|nr:winged helix-turn-helix transcriptional regulator [Marmoricola sp.]
MATLIGDLVHSRRSADRAGLHARLTEALAIANAGEGMISPLRITVGDEYQGTFASLPDAVRAAWRLRVRMLPECDVRQGLGWGEVRVLQEDPPVEDGPGWWVARDAVHVVELAQERPATAWRRTAYRRVEDAAGPDPRWVESMLVLCDQAVGGLSPRSLSVLDGLLEGRTQREIAEQLGITPSAVSQRVRADGLGAMVAAEALMGGVA